MSSAAFLRPLAGLSLEDLGVLNHYLAFDAAKAYQGPTGNCGHHRDPHYGVTVYSAEQIQAARIEVDPIQLPALLSRYAARLHSRRCEAHHVVSALGAWVLLALCAELAVDEWARRELADALGIEPRDAAALAAELLEEPHPLVADAAGVWFSPQKATPRIDQWARELPRAVETGDLPSQAQIDRWTSEHTLGLIKRFPLALSPDTVCLLATALATKVSWDKPFESSMRRL